MINHRITRTAAVALAIAAATSPAAAARPADGPGGIPLVSAWSIEVSSAGSSIRSSAGRRG